MTDDRAGDPVRGSRPATTGSDAVRSSALGGPASAPFRIPVATPASSHRPTMVRLTRRSGPRFGLRPPGAALTAPPPEGSSPGTPSSGILSPAARVAPSTRAPVDAVTLPAGRVPASVVTRGSDEREASEPATDAVREPSAAPPPSVPPPSVPPPSAPPRAEPRPDVDPHPARPGAGTTGAPAARNVLALAVTSAPAEAPAPMPSAAGPAPASASPSASASASAPSEPASGGTGPPAPEEERRRPTAAEARVGEADYAATSAVLAAVGARFATWRSRWGWPRALRLLTATCALLVVVVCGLGWGAASWVEAAVRQIGALDPNSPAIQDAAAQAGDQNFLVVGSDSRAGAPPSEDAGDTADIPGARTDTIMIVHVPEDRSGVTVVSFPRDLEITRPACERWDPITGAYSPQMLPPTPRVKLNSAYAAGGPRCVTRAVQELSGLAVNRFLGVDFQGFQGMVDSMRGVPICVERPVQDSVLGPIVTQAGPTVLNGRQALDYVRARHVEGDPSSDYGRIQRQQRFLGALLRSVLSAGTLLDPSRLNGLVEAVSRSTFGENIGSDQLLTLSQSLGTLDPHAVSFVTVPTTGIANDRGNEVLRPAAERAMFNAIIEGHPLPGAPGAPVAPAPAPADVRLVDGRSPVDEGSDESSDDDSESGDSEDAGSSSGPSASSIAERLRSASFGVVTDDSGSSTDTHGTTIRYSPDQAAAAQALAAAVPGAPLELTSSGNGTLTLVLGDDFDGRVRSGAEASGSAPSAPVNPTITAADASCA